ncbi:pyruvate kinase [Desulfothermus okinawensis JCM 13304]
MHIKIIATIGPSSTSKEVLREMIIRGVTIFRLNFSHNTPKGFIPIINTIKSLESELKIPITLMGDLSGPKIRIGEVKDSPLYLGKGYKAILGVEDLREKYEDKKIPFLGVKIKEAIAGLKVGMKAILSDGVPVFKVEEVLEPDCAYLLDVESGGTVSSNKGINFPGKHISLPALTDIDKANLHEAMDLGIDAFALSFVQNKQDIIDIKNEIQKHKKFVPVIAKLERANGVENLEEILEAADGIMVARGDLGLECPLPSLPIIQKRIINACKRQHKPAIVATQMLLSMVHNPLPTRAETTDVANAIMDGADCVMLSDETAIGNYPIEVIDIISEIAANTENYIFEQRKEPLKPQHETNLGSYLAYSACLLANYADAKGIACHSTSGKTARLISSCRPEQKIYGLTPHMEVIKYLNFMWGVTPINSNPDIPNHLDRVENFVQNSELFRAGDKVIITSGQPTPGQLEKHTNQIKIYFK